MGLELTKSMYYYFMYFICMPSGQNASTIQFHDGAHGSASGNMLDADSIIVHPKFSSRYDDYNIALLRLKTELEYNQEVAPVCLSHAPRSSSSLCFTMGYDHTGRYLTILNLMNE